MNNPTNAFLGQFNLSTMSHKARLFFQNLQDYGLFLVFGWILNLLFLIYGYWQAGLLWLVFTRRIFYLDRPIWSSHLGLSGIALILSLTLWQAPNLTLGPGDYLLKLDPYKVTLEQGRLSGNAKVLVGDKWQPVQIQAFDLDHLPDRLDQVEYWQVNGQVQLPDQARNFGVFDYRAYLRTQNIHYQIKIKKLLALSKAQDFISRLYNQRFKFVSHFLALDAYPLFSIYNRLVWNLESSAYKSVRQGLVELGIIHFFALSGLHVSLLLKKLDHTLRRLGVTNEVGNKLTLAVGLLYCFLTGFPVGVIRSVAMVGLAPYMKRSRMDRLALIAGTYLFLRPYAVLNLGFILSFMMSLVLILMDQAKLPSWLKGDGATTLLCLLFSWPFTMGQSYYWYPMQLVWALILGKALDRILWPFALFMTGLSFVPQWLPQSIWAFLGKGLTYLQTLNPKIAVGSLSWVWICLLLILAVWTLEDFKQGFKWSILAYIVLILMAGRWHLDRIIVLDVGQGDALLFQPAFSNRGVVIDVGGKPVWGQNNQADLPYDPNYAERNLLPALRALAVKGLDQVILTHADLDHVGNLPALLSNFQVESLLVSDHTSQDPTFQKMVAAYQGQVYLVQDQRQIHVGPLSIWSLGPLSSGGQDQSNAASLVVKFTLDGLTFINMGDLPAEGELALLKDQELKAVDVIKLGHHGSSSSSSETLLRVLKPKLALNSAGLDNRYGHPHQEVIDRLAAHQIPLVSTHELGAIQLSRSVLGSWQLRTVIQK